MKRIFRYHNRLLRLVVHRLEKLSV
jgi:hypothetical protein